MVGPSKLFKKNLRGMSYDLLNHFSNNLLCGVSMGMNEATLEPSGQSIGSLVQHNHSPWERRRASAWHEVVMFADADWVFFVLGALA